MPTPKSEPRLPIALSPDQLGLLENILKYYPIQQDYSESFYEDRKFVSDLTNFAKEAFPFTKRSYKLSVSETEAEKLSDAIFNYEWEDEVWQARPREERAALLDFEERLGRLLDQFKKK